MVFMAFFFNLYLYSYKSDDDYYDYDDDLRLFNFISINETNETNEIIDNNRQQTKTNEYSGYLSFLSFYLKDKRIY